MDISGGGSPDFSPSLRRRFVADHFHGWHYMKCALALFNSLEIEGNRRVYVITLLERHFLDCDYFEMCHSSRAVVRFDVKLIAMRIANPEIP